MAKIKPTITIDVYLVEIGYQIDITANGQTFSECRDFADDRNIADSTQDFYRRFIKLVDEFRAGQGRKTARHWK